MPAVTKEAMKEWLLAALIRAVRTFAQTLLALIPAGVTIQEVGWAVAGSTALLASVLSMLTSLAGLPEASGGKPVNEIMEGADGQA